MTNFPAARSSSTLIFGIKQPLDLVKLALLNWWHYLFHITFYIQAYLQSVDLPIFLKYACLLYASRAKLLCIVCLGVWSGSVAETGTTTVSAILNPT